MYCNEDDNFKVDVCVWESMDGKYDWNIYDRIVENQPLFDDPEKAMDVLPFAGGCTYDQIETFSPSRGIEYDWQKEVKILVLNSLFSNSNFLI